MALAAASYPLRIGVTGHRNLRDEPAVAAAVEHVLDHIENTLRLGPDRSDVDRPAWSRAVDVVALKLVRPLLKVLGLPTAPTSPAQVAATELDWTVISPLAKGADRIVAHAVLRKPDAKLRAVWPLPLDEYRKDFEAGDDLIEFEKLLQRDGTTQTELISQEDATDVDWSNDQNRNHAYYNVGRYVVDSCELLIAIWDGNVAAGFGGTGDIVRYAISRGRRVIWIDADEPHRPPCLLEPDPAGQVPFQGAAVAPLPTRPKHLSLGYHRLASYNRDRLISDAEVERASAQELAQLRQQASIARVPLESLSLIEQCLLPLYARADSMATAYQRLYLFGAKALFRLAALAVSVAVFQLLFFPASNWIIAFEVLAMLTAVFLLRVSRVEAWHEKWLRDRHMAEWLRSATYTVLLGEHHHAKARAEKLPFYEGPDQWFVDTLRGSVENVKAKMPTIELDALKKHLVDGWIVKQAEWHAGNAVRKKGTAHFYHRAGVACFCLTLIMATLHLFGVGHGDHSTPDGHAEETAVEASHSEHEGHHSGTEAQPPRDASSNRLADISLWISFLAVVLPAWGASIHAVASLLEYDRIAVRSDHMAHVLKKIAERAGRSNSLDTLAAEISFAEEIMATENHEWVVSLKFRELVLPA